MNANQIGRKDGGNTDADEIARASADMAAGIVNRRMDAPMTRNDLMRILANCEADRNTLRTFGKIS
jgi:hypothetical protein